MKNRIQRLVWFLPFLFVLFPQEAKAQFNGPFNPYGYWQGTTFYQPNQVTYFRSSPNSRFFFSITNGYPYYSYGPPLFFPSGSTLVPTYPVLVRPAVIQQATMVRPIYPTIWSNLYPGGVPFGAPIGYQGISTISFYPMFPGW